MEVINPFVGTAYTDALWANMIVNLRGEAWKDVRSTFSPIFTSGKMKVMMHHINRISANLVEAVGDGVGGREIDAKLIFQTFSLDALATCAFGVDVGGFRYGNMILMSVREKCKVLHLLCM